MVLVLENQMKKIHFKKVKPTSDHLESLFALLSKRKFSISHKKPPSKHEHELFVKNHPYKDWYVIVESNDIVGSVYITFVNSFSIDLLPSKLHYFEEVVGWVYANFEPLSEKKSLIPNHLYINIPYKNKDFINRLKKMGLSPVQISFKKN